MQVVVLGATGRLGRAVVDECVRRGHGVIAVSRRAARDVGVGVVHRAADVVRGDGIHDALRGGDVVVDATNAVWRARSLLIGGTQRVLAAAARAGVRHYVGVSIVGIDDVRLAYYRTKLQQEHVVAASPVPWSLLRATQFHDLVAALANGKLGTAIVPAGVPLQPIDVRDVAPHVVDAAERPAAGRLPDVAGPEVAPMRELVRAWCAAAGRRRLIVRMPLLGELGRALRRGALCAPQRAVGTRTFAAWLQERYGESAARR